MTVVSGPVGEIPMTTCRVCQVEVPEGEFCELCGVRLTARPSDGPEWLRPHAFGAAPAEHLFRPSLFQQWATLVNGDPTWIEYEIHATKQHFVNVTASGFPAMDVPHYDSAELVNTTHLQIGRPEIEAARNILEGRVESTKLVGDGDAK